MAVLPRENSAGKKDSEHFLYDVTSFSASQAKMLNENFVILDSALDFIHNICNNNDDNNDKACQNLGQDSSSTKVLLMIM